MLVFLVERVLTLLWFYVSKIEVNKVASSMFTHLLKNSPAGGRWCRKKISKSPRARIVNHVRCSNSGFLRIPLIGA